MPVFPYPLLELARNEIRLLYPVANEGPLPSPGREMHRHTGDFCDTRPKSSLKFELRSVSLDDAPAYTALLYVWGTPDPPENIVVNGHPFSIGPNIHSALRHLLDEHIKPAIWIDAICINQIDNIEKNDQIPKMSAIYSGARAVLIWLGEETIGCLEFSQIAQNMLSMGSEESFSKIPTGNFPPCLIKELPEAASKAVQQSSNSHRTMFPDVETLFEFLVSHILSRDWWYRVWTIQEWALAKSAYFHIGSQRIHRYAIGLLFVFFWKMQNDIAALSGREEELFKRRLGLADHKNNVDFHLDLFALQTNSQGKHRTAFKPLRSVIPRRRITFTRGAADARDRVFALRGLAEKDFERMGIVIDYTKECHDVYIQLAQSFIRSGNLEILSFRGFRDLEEAESRQTILHPGVCDKTRLPTWAPDWTSYLEVAYTNEELVGNTLYAASGSTTVIYTFPSHHDLGTGSVRSSVKLRAQQNDKITVIGLAPLPKGASARNNRRWILSYLEEIAEMTKRSQKLGHNIYTKAQLEDAPWRIPTWDIEDVLSDGYSICRATDLTKARYVLFTTGLRLMELHEQSEALRKSSSRNSLNNFWHTFIRGIVGAKVFFYYILTSTIPSVSMC